jgi:hypothetical protein
MYRGRVGKKDIIIFNQAFADKKEMGHYTKFDTEDTPIEDIEWDQLLKLEHPDWGKFYSELAPGIYYQIRDACGNYQIFGTPDKEVCVKKPE